jgi:cobalt-zinc-cadmium resistance protein CzcA
VRGRDLGSTVTEVQERIAHNVKVPDAVIASSGPASFRICSSRKQRLAIVVPVALLLILVLLYALFNSFKDSLFALAGIPFAAAGGLIALLIAGLPFSISAAIGFVSLLGVSVMHGILMFTYYNTLRMDGMRSAEAIYYAAENAECGRC